MNSDDLLHVSLIGLIKCLTEALDLISPILGGHHKRTAYIASSVDDRLSPSISKRTRKISTPSSVPE